MEALRQELVSLPGGEERECGFGALVRIRTRWREPVITGACLERSDLDGRLVELGSLVIGSTSARAHQTQVSVETLQLSEPHQALQRR